MLLRLQRYARLIDRLEVFEPKCGPGRRLGARFGAGDGTRTRDSLLGKQELYH
jgi:hypothetical protein